MAGRVFSGSNEGDPTVTLTDEQLKLIVTDLEPRLQSRMNDYISSRLEEVEPSIQARMDSYMASRFKTLKDQFNVAVKVKHEARNTAFEEHIKKMCNDLPSLVDRTVAESSTVREPLVLQDVTFPGGHSRLRSFLHQIKSALILHEKSFADDSARINWVSRHFRPDTSSSHLWWMSLIHSNALAQQESDPYKSAGLRFIIHELSSIDNFLDSLVKEFRDPFLAESAINALRDCRMTKNSSVPDFNSRFTVLAGEAEVTEASKMSYYKDSLLDHLCSAVVVRPDWSSATTLRMQQQILVQVEKGLADAKNSRSRPQPSPAYPALPNPPSALPAQSIAVPRDPNAMEVDASSTAPFPNQVFWELCTERKICTSCLGVYDAAHKGAYDQSKGVAGRPRCPNASAPFKDKIALLKRLQAERQALQPSSVPHPPAGPPAPVQATSFYPAPQYSHFSLPQAQYFHQPPSSLYQPQPSFHATTPHSQLPLVSQGYPSVQSHQVFTPHVPQPTYQAVPVQSSATCPAAFSQVPTFPGFHFGMVPLLPAYASPVPTVSTPMATTPVPAVQPIPTSVSAAFSEYANLDEPNMYDNAGLDVSALSFSGIPAGNDFRVTLYVWLMSGGRRFLAKALVD